MDRPFSGYFYTVIIPTTVYIQYTLCAHTIRRYQEKCYKKLLLRSSVEVRVGKSFIAVGGTLKNQQKSKSIFFYDQEANVWTELPAKLTRARSLHTAFLIPRQLVNCL